MRRGSIALAAIVFALAVSAPAVRAQTPETETPAPAVTSTPAPPSAPPAAPAPEPPAAANTSTPAARIPIVGYELGGSRIDPDDQLRALMFSVAALGDPFVEAGPSDRVGRPFGTIPRLLQALDAVGYRAALSTRAVGGGVVIVATLLPYERLRYVFVSGNRRIQQDEIQRRITIRPGQTLPPAGPERAVVLERERELIIDFLRGRGFFEANVGLDARPGSKPGSLDLYVTVRLGPAYPLGPITITGNHALATDELDPMFRHGDWLTLWNTPVPFTQKQLREDMDALTKRYRAAGYAGVRVTTDFSVQKSVDRAAKDVRIGIAINERKRIAVAFEGNSSQSSSALQDELTLFSRGSYDDYEVAASADAIQRHYQQQGNFFARVEWRRERLSADQERIVFSIDEGPVLKVRGVEFAGAHALPPQELAEVVSVRPYPFWGIGSGGYATGKQLEQDVERLLAHYRARGFVEVRARVDAATSRAAVGALGATAAATETTSRGAGELYVRFTIDEGPRLTLVAEDLRSTDATPLPYDPRFLLGSLTLRPGAPYAPPVVSADAKHLVRLLGDAGYPSATVTPDVNRKGNEVTLAWAVTLGPRMRVGPIFVRGNFVTRPRTILQQIRLQTGDYLSTTPVERSQRDIGFLQLFNNATPISFPGKDDRPLNGSEDQTVPMLVNVEERYEQYRVLHFGAGASTDQKPPDSSFPFGVYVRGGYDDRNLGGRGWALTSQLTYGTAILRGNVGFLDRRFLGTLFRLDASFTYLSQETVRLGDIHSGGGSIGFSREMYPGVDAGLHYNLRNTTHTEPLLRESGPNENTSSVTLGTTVGSLSANVEWLRMDNRLLPTRGFRIDAIAELALPALSVPLRPFPFAIGDDTFLKVGVHSLSVIPLGKHLYLRHGFRYDQGFPFGGAALLPKVERYFAGGDTTIRGYQLDHARVEVQQYPLSPNPEGGLYAVEYHPIGGNLRVLQNIDLQFPIMPPWYGSVFMDNGVVADSFSGLGLSQFRHGVGVSPLLIRLPIGDVSLAWGWPLDPGPGDTRIGVLHVNVGLMF
ncbi:MAG TPA: POTRA domain-containing protein [Polyangia bacterium]|nr:POTRA domain-containing protein [Polyangia bacterium]